MRIIDKNRDYYDYLQDPTDTIVFDRRGSWELTRKEMYDRAKGVTYDKRNHRFILLQCGATFWLFYMKMEQGDYNLDLISTWKNYDKPNALLKFELIYPTGLKFWFTKKSNSMEFDNVLVRADDLRAAVDRSDYRVEKNLSYNCSYISKKNGWDCIESKIPLLKSCGIAALIIPLDMFCAIEEYFSIEKTKAETTEPKGATNDDKIIMHGFDTKTSFRGK